MDFRRLSPDDRWLYTYKCDKCGYQNDYLIELPRNLPCTRDIHLLRNQRCDGRMVFVSVRPAEGNKSKTLPELKHENQEKKDQKMRKLGTYKARAIGSVLGVAGTGTEQIVVTFEITSEGSRKGEQYAWYGFFTDATTSRTLDALENAGWDGESLENPAGLGRVECEIVLGEEEYNGETKVRVQWVNKPGGGGVKNVMSPQEAKSFNERMKGEIAARKAERAQRQASGDGTDFNYGANVPDKPPV
jgi:hypothetical protein